MKRFTSILLAINEHGDAVGAIEWAASVAQENRASLHVLQVIEALPPDVRARLDLAQPIVCGDPERTALRRYTSHLTEQTASIRAEGIPGEARAVIGVPAQTIADEARRLGCDLVILGAQPPHGLMQRLFGGSTADKLLRRLDCSVLILHAGEISTGAMGKWSLPVKSVSQ